MRSRIYLAYLQVQTKITSIFDFLFRVAFFELQCGGIGVMVTRMGFLITTFVKVENLAECCRCADFVAVSVVKKPTKSFNAIQLN